MPDYLIEYVTEQEQEELKRRERAYRGGLPPPDVRDRTVILVDDGLATGATMQAAMKALRQQNPARIVVAVPVASHEACEEMRTLADDVTCAITPEPFHAVGLWYEDFSQTTDEEVRELLARRRQPEEKPTTPDAAEGDIVGVVRRSMHPLTGAREDYDPLMSRIGDARIVLLGEASHGTHEFYRERALITQRLIEEKGFLGVAVEADWPDAWRVNRYVRDESGDFDAVEALADFRRFPTWMWRNTEVVEFLGWLRAHNDSLAPDAPSTGFYGLDLYSLRASMRAVLQYLEKVDPEAAKRARERYACFDQFGEEAQVYGFIAGTDRTKSCREAVVSQLVALQGRVMEYERRGGRLAEDEFFAAEQNARVVKNAEAYYRAMFVEDVSSWNLRDQHMAETLDALIEHIGRHGQQAKIVVWAHNSHLGDARATEMSRRGELNVGQLVREKYGQDAVLIGFTTHHGTVTAASDWNKPAERKRVRAALPGSYETMFHHAQPNRFLLTWRGGDEVAQHLRNPLLERAIGVIYRPETERISHYFQARLADQFDAVIHFDETRAVKPLEYTAEWEAGEVPETFPFAV
jgi:erythromycin esterase-like protein